MLGKIIFIGKRTAPKSSKEAAIKDIQRQPFERLGKSEPLKFAFKGYWSRRIDDEHRMVYKVDGNSILIAQCRYHY